jgi:hypothetical protein
LPEPGYCHTLSRLALGRRPAQGAGDLVGRVELRRLAG